MLPVGNSGLNALNFNNMVTQNAANVGNGSLKNVLQALVQNQTGGQPPAQRMGPPAPAQQMGPQPPQMGGTAGGGGPNFAPALPAGMPPELQKQVLAAAAEQERQKRMMGYGTTGRAMAALDSSGVDQRTNEAAMAKANWEQEQQNQSALQKAERIYKLAVPVYGPERAKLIAQQAMTDDAFALETLKELGGLQKENRTIFQKNIEEANTKEERYGVYRAFQIPDEVARALANDDSLSAKDGIDAFFAREDSAEAKMQLQHEARWAQVREMDKFNNAVRQVSRSIGLTDWTTTGLIGAMMRGIPGTDARNLAEMLKTQQASIAFQTLVEMRQASTTGGALGNVSNREIELLYSSFGALDPNMSDEELMTTLVDILMKYEGMRYAIANEDLFNERGMSAIEMEQMVDDHVNTVMRKARGVPDEAWQEVMENPSTAGQFEEVFGFMPRLGTWRSMIEWENG
jgi:hypothetical protein